MNESQVMHALGLDDAYHVERVLASGAAGVTELVSIDGCGPFVRKKMPLALANRDAWARLGNAGSDRLPRVAATYEMPDQFVAVYDYVPGSILEETVRSGGAYPADEAIRCMLEICEAVGALHAVGVIHLDLTPRNVVMAADGAHVIDLGLSRVLSEPVPRVSRPLGTWGFAAPEQCGFGTTDERTDTYAIGKLLAYLLVGECEDFDQPSFDIETHSDVPAALRAIISRACRMEPSRRYQSVGELAEALRGARDENVAQSPGGIPWEVAGTGEVVGTGDVRDTPLEGSNGVLDGDRSGRDVSSCARDAESSHSEVSAGTGRFGSGRPSQRVVLGIAAFLALLIVVAAVVLGHEAPSASDASKAASSANSKAEATASRDDAGSSTRGNVERGQSAASASAAVGDERGGVLSPEIVESGYAVEGQGYVHYGVAIKNPNEDVLLEYAGFRVTGYAKDGTVVFSDEQYVGALGSGETHWFGGQAGNGTAPARVEFTPIEPGDYAVRRSRATTAAYEVDGLTMAVDALGDETCSGTVKMVDAGGYRGSGDGVAVAIILRDGAGKIACGFTVFVDSVREGATVPFSGLLVGAPEYATAEAHALAW